MTGWDHRTFERLFDARHEHHIPHGHDFYRDGVVWFLTADYEEYHQVDADRFIRVRGDRAEIPTVGVDGAEGVMSANTHEVLWVSANLGMTITTMPDRDRYVAAVEEKFLVGLDNE